MKTDKIDAITNDQKKLARYAKAISHPIRVYILEHLSKQACCYSGDLTDLLPIAKSTLSQHLKELRNAGLIQGEIETPRMCCIKAPDTEAERLVQIAGMVHEVGKPTQGVPKATVVAKEARMTAKTDDQGRYSFRKLPEGKHTFQVLVSGKKVQEASVTVPSASYDIEV